jgi:hypothetical protein
MRRALIHSPYDLHRFDTWISTETGSRTPRCPHRGRDLSVSSSRRPDESTGFGRRSASDGGSTSCISRIDSVVGRGAAPSLRAKGTIPCL